MLQKQNWIFQIYLESKRLEKKWIPLHLNFIYNCWLFLPTGRGTPSAGRIHLKCLLRNWSRCLQKKIHYRICVSFPLGPTKWWDDFWTCRSDIAQMFPHLLSLILKLSSWSETLNNFNLIGGMHASTTFKSFWSYFKFWWNFIFRVSLGVVLWYFLTGSQ